MMFVLVYLDDVKLPYIFDIDEAYTFYYQLFLYDSVPLSHFVEVMENRGSFSASFHNLISIKFESDNI